MSGSTVFVGELGRQGFPCWSILTPSVTKRLSCRNEDRDGAGFQWIGSMKLREGSELSEPFCELPSHRNQEEVDLLMGFPQFAESFWFIGNAFAVWQENGALVAEGDQNGDDVLQLISSMDQQSEMQFKR